MADVAPLPQPWERQPAESEEAWLCFRVYRDMAPDERHVLRSGPYDTSKLSKWFRDHNWQQRCVAYDAHFDTIRVEEREKIMRRKAQEVAIDHMMILADARELVQRELRKYLVSSREGDMHGLLKPSELQRLLESAIKLDRLVRGESTENVTTALDYTKLSLEELKTLERLYEKAGIPTEPA